MRRLRRLKAIDLCTPAERERVLKSIFNPDGDTINGHGAKVITLSIEMPRRLWRMSARANRKVHGWTIGDHYSLGDGWVRYDMFKVMPPTIIGPRLRNVG